MSKLCDNKDSTKYYSSRQEQYIANYIDGKLQPGSGAGKFKKSDVITDNFLIECKTAMTRKESFSIKENWLEKLKAESLMNHRSNYALAFNFGGDNEKNNYFVLDEKTFLQMKIAYDNYILNENK